MASKVVIDYSAREYRKNIYLYMNTFFFNHLLYRSPDIFIHHRIFDPNISLGEIISVIVLVITARVLYLQVRETKKSTKYLEYQSRPTAFFLLFRSLMYVKNTSMFLVKFYFKMSSDGKTLNDNHWTDNKDGPLYIYPGDKYMQYPHAFNVSKLTMGEIKIEYRVVPSHIDDTELYKDTQIIKWKYDTNSKKWRGPNGISEEGILSFFTERQKQTLLEDFPELKEEYPESFPTETRRE